MKANLSGLIMATAIYPVCFEQLLVSRDGYYECVTSDFKNNRVNLIKWGDKLLGIDNTPNTSYFTAIRIIDDHGPFLRNARETRWKYVGPVEISIKLLTENP